MSSIVLFGSNGQLGWELQRSLSVLAPIIPCVRRDADFERPAELRTLIRRHRPAFIVNAAAFTNVDKAEDDRATAMQVNHAAVEVLAEEAQRVGACLVHYSSDYVFDGGKNSAYVETDATCPLNVYGQSKAASEQVVRSICECHLIIRCSWLYSAHGTNFPLRLLHQAKQTSELKVVADSVGAPTSTFMMADLSAIMLRQMLDEGRRKSLSGLYHISAAGAASWFDFAKFLIAQAEHYGVHLKATADCVLPTSREAYGSLAARPENSRLDCSLAREKFSLYLPDWTVGAHHFVEALVRSKLL